MPQHLLKLTRGQTPCDDEALRQAIELALDSKPTTAKDFDILSDHIFARTDELLSRNTLRRIWKRINSEVTPRTSTLNILARFLGYKDYTSFCQGNAGSNQEESSTIILGRRIEVINGLTRGDKIRLTWKPDRVCDVQYNGSLHFTVVRSENTRLKPGDTFLCGIIREGHPLYLEQLQQGESTPTGYACGMNGGVYFQRLDDD